MLKFTKFERMIIFIDVYKDVYSKFRKIQCLC